MATPGEISAKPAQGDSVLLWQIGFGIFLTGAWELGGRALGSTWTSLPSLILVRLVAWASTDLLVHVATTTTEVLVGLVLGVGAGIVAGLALGSSQVLASLLRPIITALYSIPLITMAPLLILWFGLDMEPKIVLVTIVVFFLVFFNTFAGVQAIDQDLTASLQLMGSTTREEFQKVIVPASMAWIMSGIKVALPYALAAATTGELLAARRGIGALVARAATQYDMTGLYAALFVLMLMGILIGEAAVLIERRVLRWRHATE
jgi:NitT/TauT family transport system permease protein